MEAVFLRLINMSITAGWLVLAIMVLRLLLKKASKAMVVALWALVGIRLICPYSFESVLSLVPSTKAIPEGIFYDRAPEITSGITVVDSVVNPIISETLTPNIGDSVNPVQIVLIVGSWIWCAGIIVMLLYAVISYLRIYRSVREAALFEGNVWLCDHISTPFILGMVRPRIYLPSSMNEQDMRYVIAHEKAHLERFDHIWKPLGFVLLTVYWFNPLVWVAYIFLCRDIELACDEKVIKDMGVEGKKLYSEALINCSSSRRIITACPLAFGETGVKERIKSVLAYRKPAVWLIVVSVMACVIVTICFLTNPEKKFLAGGQDVSLFLALYDNVNQSGSVFFYKKTTKENDIPEIKSQAMFSETEMSELCALLEKQKWHNDAYVDRLAYDYDGCICYDGAWIFFGYDRKFIGYRGNYMSYNCSGTDEIIQMIKDLEEKAEPYDLSMHTEGVDDFGLTMEVNFTSRAEFDVTFTHSSKKAAVAGKLTVSSIYTIRAYHDGAWISFGDYMRDVLNHNYDGPKDGWGDESYIIKADDSLVLHENLKETYGKLPVGQYLLFKSVELTDDNDKTITRWYTARFDVVD